MSSMNFSPVKTGQARDVAVGMMDKAYFTGKKELLEFFNNLLQMNLTKIEQTCTGAVACQLTEYIFPNSIPMHQVKWDAKSDYEYVHNYKLLQKAFDKNKISRYVDVNKLIKGKYQDNLEFCQWLKAFYDQFSVERENYDPVAQRLKGKGGKSTTARRPISSSTTTTTSSSSRRAPATSAASRSNTTSTIKKTSATAVKKSTTTNTDNNNEQLLLQKQKQKHQEELNDLNTKIVEMDELLEEYSTKNTTLSQEKELFETTLLEMEKERDFYFTKLRYIEVMLQVYQEHSGGSEEKEKMINHVIDKVFKVLYATEDDNIEINEENGEFVHNDQEERGEEAAAAEEENGNDNNVDAVGEDEEF